MNIEENFEQLDNIIAALENKDMPLEDAFKEYEKGIKLVRECSSAIDKVEKDIITLQGGEDENREDEL